MNNENQLTELFCNDGEEESAYLSGESIGQNRCIIKDNFLRLYWCDDLVGRIYDPWHYDFPRAWGRFEPVNTDSEVYFFLVCLSEANKEVDPGPYCERFPDRYFKGWSLVNPDGITQQITFPDPEFDATSMTIRFVAA